MFSPPSLIVMLLVLIPASLRLMDFQWNIACIGALSMFCGLYIRQRWLAITIPLAAMVVSDIGLGLFNHDLPKYTMDPLRPVVYAAYVVMISLGISVRRYWQKTNALPVGESTSTAKPSWQRFVPVAGATLIGSLLFFFTTNFGVWVLNDFYPHTWDGLASCIAAGIPFYRTTLASDVVFTLILVGSYELFFKGIVPVTSASRMLYAE
ncbi:MAG: hypothetical protein O2955_06720 [Planctomycetota bacterium]|nr:hypothetical protein [Planctomycetota bacterium]MDA1212188.1 hypothetical protein [Planctomycetota bacterium]